MSAEADAVCGAEYGQRIEGRVNSRNGHRAREWDTRAGTIELAIPKLRTGSPETFPAPENSGRNDAFVTRQRQIALKRGLLRLWRGGDVCSEYERNPATRRCAWPWRCWCAWSAAPVRAAGSLSRRQQWTVARGERLGRGVPGRADVVRRVEHSLYGGPPLGLLRRLSLRRDLPRRLAAPLPPPSTNPHHG
jgi:hypothetical protein